MTRLTLDIHTDWYLMHACRLIETWLEHLDYFTAKTLTAETCSYTDTIRIISCSNSEQFSGRLACCFKTVDIHELQTRWSGTQSTIWTDSQRLLVVTNVTAVLSSRVYSWRDVYHRSHSCITSTCWSHRRWQCLDGGLYRCLNGTRFINWSQPGSTYGRQRCVGFRNGFPRLDCCSEKSGSAGCIVPGDRGRLFYSHKTTIVTSLLYSIS